MPENEATHAKHLLVVVGPTAVGKTELSVKLARRYTTEIISADSRQIFREMNIGTAKPCLAERKGIAHHFIDSHSIQEAYNAGDFERDSLYLLKQLFKYKDVVIVTGGSGLYIKALCEGIDYMPDINPFIRIHLNELFQKQGLEVLLQQLDHIDPVYARIVDRANPQRVIRALEVSLSSGIPYSSFRKQNKIVRPFHIIKIGLQRNREELYARIDARMDIMLQDGLVEEVKALLPWKMHNALQTVGYSEVFDFLEGKYDETEMVRLLKRNSRHYAKRQLTWFSKDTDIQWFHPDAYEHIEAYVDKEIKQET
jgi:tRNA dimethylallyltransferase